MTGPSNEKPTFTYRDLYEAHPCGTPPGRKKAFFTVMEDGQIVLIIAEAHPDDEHLTGSTGDPTRTKIEQPVRWKILEYIHMRREDMNVWFHLSRKWWDEEKIHPSVPITRSVGRPR